MRKMDDNLTRADIPFALAVIGIMGVFMAMLYVGMRIVAVIGQCPR